MGVIKGISKYVIILFLGVLMAFFVAWIQYDTQDLSASVLSLKEQNFFESTNRDAWYKRENQIFEVFISEQARNQWTLFVSVLYSPSDVERFTDKIDTNYFVEVVQQDDWNLILKVDWYENWDFTEWLFELPYSGDFRELTLEYIKSKNLDFAIWNLDNIERKQSH